MILPIVDLVQLVILDKKQLEEKCKDLVSGKTRTGSLWTLYNIVNVCMGLFLIGATNRADLLDPALIRPGRVDKRIFINNPDEETREAILNIHLQGKPRDESVTMPDLVETTQGYSGAQIENLVNAAMLLALRENRNKFTSTDIDAVYNRVIGGWQPTKHEFTPAIIDQIAIHELGHAVVGMLAKHHGKMKKVVINLSAPNTPALII